VNFTRRRGLWMGFCAGVGNGAGSTFMPVIAGMLMLGSGWRGAYRDIGLIVLGVGFPLLYLLLRDMPHLPASAVAQAAGLARRPGELSLAQALRRAPFWMILSAIAISGGCMIAVFAHVVPLLMDKGFALSQATLVLSVFALTCAVWQSTVGWVLDRTESPRVTAPLYLVAALGLAIMQHASGLPAMIIAGAMLGIALGTEFGMLGYLISRYFGVASFGAISGVMFAVVLLAQAVSPYLMDLTFDRTGSYALALDIVEAAMVAACAVIALLPRYPFALSEN
jgi:predicted MFS family arabinose efflux permease